MKINYYILCWGNNYFNNLIQLSLKTFFCKLPNNFNDYTHNLYIFSRNDNQSLKFVFNIKKLLKKKNINVFFKNFSSYIKLYNIKKLNQWRLLGLFQNKAIIHAEKKNAKCIFVYPDEVHSENLISILINNIQKKMILIPSNELNGKKIKNKILNILKKDNLTEKKISSFFTKSNMDIVGHLFFSNLLCISHYSRYYLFRKNFLLFKSLHLAPICIDPKIFLKKSFFKKGFYNLDSSYGNKIFFDKKIIYPDEAVVISLEENVDKNINITKGKNFLFIFFLRIIYQVMFNFKNIDGLDPFNYLRNFKIYINKKEKCENFEFIIFHLFSIINFFFSSILFIFYFILKVSKYIFLDYFFIIKKFIARVKSFLKII